jgi:hypothetical protein
VQPNLPLGTAEDWLRTWSGGAGRVPGLAGRFGSVSGRMRICLAGVIEKGKEPNVLSREFPRLSLV